jgi:hypothetical protein
MKSALEKQREMAETRLNMAKTDLESIDLDAITGPDAEAEYRKTRMAPAGALNLPALLDERRLHYMIPDGAFQLLATVYERICVYQLTDVEGDTYVKGGSIVMPDTVKHRKKLEAPRGIIIGAGLRSLDVLRTNGMDLGHIVRFVRNAPYRFIVDDWKGVPTSVMVMQAGDIVASEDISAQLTAGTCKYDLRDGQHVFVDAQGNYHKPAAAWIPEDV